MIILPKFSIHPVASIQSGKIQSGEDIEKIVQTTRDHGPGGSRPTDEVVLQENLLYYSSKLFIPSPSYASRKLYHLTDYLRHHQIRNLGLLVYGTTK